MDTLLRFYRRPWVRDTIERVAWTFTQGALGTVAIESLAAGNPSAWTAALVGGIAAVLSLLKAVAARHIGYPDTAATLRSPTP